MSFSSHQTFLSGPPQPLVVVRPQPDADAFELYCRLAPAARPSFLLESANGTDSTARYSFFGRDPYLTLTSRAQDYRIETGGQIRHYQGSGLQALQQALARSTITRPEGLPPFYGGARRIPQLRPRSVV
jgi:anthranilate/para-aminobenzoate synthase component I